MNKRSLIAGVLSVCLMLAMLPAAFAVEQGEANITPQTTMKELRENPSIKGSGYYTYCREMLPIESLYWQNKTLALCKAGTGGRLCPGNESGDRKL